MRAKRADWTQQALAARAGAQYDEKGFKAYLKGLGNDG